jgi:hypothetical protein
MNLSEATPFIAGPGIGLGALLLSYLSLRRGNRADDAAQENMERAQVYAGYGGLLEKLQEDNAELRRSLAAEREGRAAERAAAEERVLLLLQRLEGGRRS